MSFSLIFFLLFFAIQIEKAVEELQKHFQLKFHLKKWGVKEKWKLFCSICLLFLGVELNNNEWVLHHKDK